LIKEYKQYGLSWNPTCSDFYQSVNDDYHFYSTADFMVDDQYSWFAYQHNVLYNATCVISWAQLGIPHLNSGYRNPAFNLSVSRARNSRHTYGDAVDLRMTDLDGWWRYFNIAHNTGGYFCTPGCVEPRQYTPTWVHLDYRGACPSGY